MSAILLIYVKSSIRKRRRGGGGGGGFLIFENRDTMTNPWIQVTDYSDAFLGWSTQSDFQTSVPGTFGWFVFGCFFAYTFRVNL